MIQEKLQNNTFLSGDNKRARNNRTLTMTDEERDLYRSKILFHRQGTPLSIEKILNNVICTDLFCILNDLPDTFADLLILDPPYNLNKNFHGNTFTRISDADYMQYLERWFPVILRCLKPNGSIYLCGDWQNSGCLYAIMTKYTILRNRITWQREKGRGSRKNWKNSSEDIWFGTKSNTYYFNADAVKQKRRVIAPYKQNGHPKDWEETENGKFRLTYPSNLWDDITVPYWSMPENTDHPTQKSEKLLAKLILASSPEKGIVFDPFSGSGSTAVTATKLGRSFVAIEQNEEYCLWTEKRLACAETDHTIQGYTGGVFWERNTFSSQAAQIKTMI